MRVSPDNSKIAVSLSGVAFELILSPFALNFYGGSFQLYDFDNNTGIASNQVNVIPAPSTFLLPSISRYTVSAFRPTTPNCTSAMVCYFDLTYPI